MYKNKIKFFYNKIVLFVFLCFFVITPMATHAGNLSTWRDSLNSGASTAGVNTEIKSPEPIIETVIMTLLSFLGVLFLILMIYGGFLWMTARGNEEQVTKSKNLMIAAIIGLIIVLASYAISFFVFNALSETALDF